MTEEKASRLLDAMIGKTYFYNGTKETFQSYYFKNDKVVITTSHAAFRRHPLEDLTACLNEYLVEQQSIRHSAPTPTPPKQTPPKNTLISHVHVGEKTVDLSHKNPETIGDTYKISLRMKTDEDYLREVFYLRYGHGHGTYLSCEACKKLVEMKKVVDAMRYECPECRHQFDPVSGTIFENTISLPTWLHGFRMLQHQDYDLAELCELINIPMESAYIIKLAYIDFLKTGIKAKK